MKNTPLLSLKNLTFSIPSVERALLKHINLKLYPRDFLIILGSNGSGKSSLIKCINGLYTPQKGIITLNGTNITNLKIDKIAKTVTTLTQDLNFSTFYDMTLFENCVCANLKKKSFPQKQSIKEYLGKFHSALPEKLEEHVSSLSGGERQCLALAMCLYSTPELLLLDEHTSALDPKVGKKIMEITHHQVTQRPNLSVMMTTHNLDDALKYGNRLIILHEGEIIFEATNEEKNKLTKSDLLAFY
jgi:putative tryptophan/tyrosine transport system ATP-binding protein